MLQWMGGSRRKVTTSRKSTQKRQQKYFEERKRQQQQQTAGFEGYANETSIGGEHQKEYRSLDILSLLNLSTVSEEGKSCPSRSDDKFGALKMMYHTPKDLPTSITNSVSPPYSVETKEAGTPPSSYPVELKCPNHDNQALNGMNNNSDLWNAGTEKQLSVFDMLTDDASEGNSGRSLVNEAHVAFSIEGLGKIRAETPLHSPKQQGRIYCDDSSLPWNVERQLNSSSRSSMNNLEPEVDAMMQEIDMPLGGSPLEFSIGERDLGANWKRQCSIFTDHMQLDNHYSNRKCSFSETDIFYNIGRREDACTAKTTFRNDDYLNGRKGDVSWEYWPCEVDVNYGDFLEYEKGEMLDNAFEDHHMLNKRHTPVQMNYDDIRDLPGQPQPDWPYFGTEDGEDNLSLLSEESSSSSAVWGGTINSPPPNIMARQRRRISNTFDRAKKKYDVDGLFGRERYCEEVDNIGERPNKFMRTPTFPKSKVRKPVSSSFRCNVGPSQYQAQVVEEGCNSVDEDFGFSSFHCSWEAKLPCLGSYSKQWTEDSSSTAAFHVPDRPRRPKQGESIQCSPFGCSSSPHDEKFVLCQPFNSTASDDSPILSKVGCGSVKQDLCPEPIIQVVPLPLDSSHSHRETDDKRKHWKFRPQQFGKENCAGNDHLLFSVDPVAMNGSNPGNKGLECKEVETKDAADLKLEPTCSPAPPADEHVEETSSSVKVHDKSEGSTNKKAYE